MPASKQQEGGDPVAGLNYLIYGDYIGSGVPYDFFKKKMRNEPDSVLRRTGENANVGYAATVFEAPNYVMMDYTIATDVPPLWNVKKKNALYYKGFVKWSGSRVGGSRNSVSIMNFRQQPNPLLKINQTVDQVKQVHGRQPVGEILFGAEVLA